MECKDCKHKKTCDYYKDVIEPLYEIIGYPWDDFLKGLSEYVNDNFNCQYKETADFQNLPKMEKIGNPHPRKNFLKKHLTNH